MPKKIPLFDRFFEKVEKTATCWEWRGFRTNLGYGYFRLKERHHPAHRVSLMIAGREIPGGFDVDHLCRNRGCVNPDHLEAVTHAENMRRGDIYKSATERARTRTVCRNGHPVTPETTYLVQGGKWKTCSICARKSVKKSRSGTCTLCSKFFNRLDAHLSRKHKPVEKFKEKAA